MQLSLRPMGLRCDSVASHQHVNKMWCDEDAHIMQSGYNKDKNNKENYSIIDASTLDLILGAMELN